MIRFSTTILMIFCLVRCLDYAEPEGYILPDNYQGVVVVVFGIVDGQEMNYVNRRRQYIIPENGILYTQFKNVSGILDRRFLFSTDKTKLITRALGHEDLDSTQFYVFDMIDGAFSSSFDSTETSYSSDDLNPNRIEVNYYTIGKGAVDKGELRVIGKAKTDYVIDSFPKKIVDFLEFDFQAEY